ncbi:MAG: hypothetical protein AAGA92_15370 [Planctomycetota bacterium]
MATESAMAIPAQSDQQIEPGDTPRYGVRANIENHPQVTDFVPRRYRVIGAFVAVPLAIGAVFEWGRYESGTLAQLLQMPKLEPQLNSVFARLSDWTSAVVMLLAAVAAIVVFSLRRYRVDDYRGRYRTWRLAALVSFLASANAVGKVHTLVADAGSTALGQSYLPGGAGWWLFPATLAAGWVLFRIAFDAAECRSAFAAFALSGVLLAGAAACTVGWVPSTALLVEVSVAAPILLLGGYVMAMAGCLFYARYVVLDVQGLIEHQYVNVSTATTVEPEENTAYPIQTEPIAARTPKNEAPSAWVDGTEPEEQDSGSRPRKLSKAEKRRLRKRQANQRAA